MNHTKSKVVFLYLLLSFVSSIEAQKNKDSIIHSGSNPVITHQYTADPAAMVYKDKVYLYTGHDVAPALGAPRSFSAICLSRSFSIVLAQAELLAATACCLSPMLDPSTAEPLSTAGCCLSADRSLPLSSTILARLL